MVGVLILAVIGHFEVALGPTVLFFLLLTLRSFVSLDPTFGLTAFPRWRGQVISEWREGRLSHLTAASQRHPDSRRVRSAFPT